MDRTKKTAQRQQPSGSRVRDLHPQTFARLLYQISNGLQVPIWTGEGVPSIFLGLILACIGAGCLTTGLMRTIDQIERR